MFYYNLRDERIGTRVTNKYGETAECIEYIDATHISYKIDGYEDIRTTGWKEFISGKFSSSRLYKYKKEREGQRRVNSYGNGATCVEYKDKRHIVIQFDNSDLINNTQWKYFNEGKFKSPFDKNKFGGYLGLSGIVNSNGKNPPEYELWMSMLKRCYSESIRRNRPTYDKVVCCEEWMCFKTFKEWLEVQPNYEKWKRDTTNWCLDKDILADQNHRKERIYAPDTCCLVPAYVNNLFVKVDAIRGKYPIGVYFNKDKEVFVAQCQNPFTKKYAGLGYYNTPEEAFQAYKKYKESIIKQMAEHEYSVGNITQPCYEAMMNYKVLITD